MHETELHMQAIKLQGELEVLELEHTHLINLIHTKRLALNRLGELLEIKGITI